MVGRGREAVCDQDYKIMAVNSRRHPEQEEEDEAGIAATAGETICSD